MKNYKKNLDYKENLKHDKGNPYETPFNNRYEKFLSDLTRWSGNFAIVMAYFACVYASRFYYWAEPLLLKIQLRIKELKVRLAKFFRNFKPRLFFYNYVLPMAIIGSFILSICNFIIAQSICRAILKSSVG